MKGDNYYHEPSNEAPTFVERLEQRQEHELALKKLILAVGNMYNTGSDTVILTSAADGAGAVDVITSEQHQLAGHKLADNIHDRGFGRIALIPGATKEHLKNAVQSRNVANILLIGHGTYHSWMATDGPVDWYDAGKMAKDHLKDGTFANLGCGAVRSWNYIPLGRYVVGPRGRILGKKRELTTLSEMSDLANFQILT